MTNKELAAMIGTTEKTIREYQKFGVANKIVEDALTPEQAEGYANIIGRSMQDKKKGVSMKQIIALSKTDTETIRKTIAAILKNPENGKKIISEVLEGKTETKVLIILPEYINKWYSDRAAKLGKSKSQHIADILQLIYLAETEKPEKSGNITDGRGGI